MRLAQKLKSAEKALQAQLSSAQPQLLTCVTMAAVAAVSCSWALALAASALVSVIHTTPSSSASLELSCRGRGRGKRKEGGESELSCGGGRTSLALHALTLAALHFPFAAKL